ncbi:MAG: pyridoxal-phosphate-dependent aminotransferase family protein [Acidobacteriota bacterium]
MIDDMLTMIPGPTPVHPRILARLARPTVSHLFPAFLESFRKALADFRAVCRSATGRPVIVGGGGTLAMEMALVNTVPAGSRVLVVSQGYFGDRFADLSRAFGIEAEVLGAEWGRAVPPEALAARLSAGRFDAVTITHVDTSTGTCSPAAAYCEVLRDRDEIVILDGVCATAGIDERFDEWGVDVLLTAPQKAIGAPPGLAMCLFSERAVARRKSMACARAFYADVLRWLPVMEDPGRYYSTPCVNEIEAVGEALAMVVEEGLEARFARHARIGAAFRAGLAAAGLSLFTDPSCRADTLSVVLYPDGVEDSAFRGEMMARGVTVAGCLGPIAGKAFRLGHMGNIGAGEVAAVLDAVEASLEALGRPVARGAAVSAAAPVLGGRS